MPRAAARLRQEGISCGLTIIDQSVPRVYQDVLFFFEFPDPSFQHQAIKCIEQTVKVCMHQCSFIAGRVVSLDESRDRTNLIQLYFDYKRDLDPSDVYEYIDCTDTPNKSQERCNIFDLRRFIWRPRPRVSADIPATLSKYGAKPLYIQIYFGNGGVKLKFSFFLPVFDGYSISRFLYLFSDTLLHPGRETRVHTIFQRFDLRGLILEPETKTSQSRAGLLPSFLARTRKLSVNDIYKSNVRCLDEKCADLPELGCTTITGSNSLPPDRGRAEIQTFAFKNNWLEGKQQEFRGVLQPSANRDERPDISRLQTLTVLLWHWIIRARTSEMELEETTECHLNMMVNCRKWIRNFAQNPLCTYMNLTIPVCITATVGEILKKDDMQLQQADLALRISKKLYQINTEYLIERITFLNDHVTDPQAIVDSYIDQYRLYHGIQVFSWNDMPLNHPFPFPGNSSHEGRPIQVNLEAPTDPLQTLPGTLVILPRQGYQEDWVVKICLLEKEMKHFHNEWSTLIP